MEDNKYAKTGWGRKADNIFDMELPSGQVVQVKKLDMKSIVKAGLVARLDSFTPQLLPGGMQTPNATGHNAMLDLMKDEKKFEEFEQVVDKVLLVTVLQPRVHPTLPQGYEKDEDKVYIEDIEFEDKIAIFGVVFAGTGDMSQFREGQGGDMEPVAEKPAASSSSESDGGVPAGIS